MLPLNVSFSYNLAKITNLNKYMYSSPPHHQKENLVEMKKSSKFVTHVVRVEIGIDTPPNNKHHLKYKFSNITPKLF